MPEELSCFKAYDIRGKIGSEINSEICYSIGRSFSDVMNAKNIVVGFDARETSSIFAHDVVSGITERGANAICLGLCGTEEVYWATNNFQACGGIQITASHNPIDYNGMKLVKKGSRPLEPNKEFSKIKELVRRNNFPKVNMGKILERGNEARDIYVNKVLSFISPGVIKDLTVVVNCGNGAAGPTFDCIEKRLKMLGSNLQFIKYNHNPNSCFPNGIPNPLLPDRHPFMKDKILENGADFGIAFDGDFDRCFLFDELGNFVRGEYLVGLLAEKFLRRGEQEVIVHDPRVIWNIKDVIESNSGTAIQSSTGHAFVKQKMRDYNAIYGGELSAHHYFRDFAYCDSGMIPWLITAELLCEKGLKLSDIIGERQKKFPSLGEFNFRVKDPENYIFKLTDYYKKTCSNIDHLDGASIEFNSWRFNVRASNTEPLLRLNLESRGDKELLLKQKEEITSIILGQ